MNEERILGEIQKLRDDMREDVHDLHDKIERFHDKMDKKIENHRTCIVEKIEESKQERKSCFDNCSEAVNKKVGSKWFMWIVGFIILGMIALGGYSATNKADIKELSATMKEHIKHNNQQFDDIKQMMQHNEGEE